MTSRWAVGAPFHEGSARVEIVCIPNVREFLCTGVPYEWTTQDNRQRELTLRSGANESESFRSADLWDVVTGYYAGHGVEE